MPPYFSSKFKRQLSPEGRAMYWFSTCYSQEGSTYNEVPPLAVNGEVIFSEPEQIATVDEDTLFSILPEECRDPMTSRRVFEHWIQDCSGAFIKPPTIESCLAHTEVIWDSNAPVATLAPTEEDSDWILQWVPTKVKVDTPTFQIYWAPSYKTQHSSRIPFTDEMTLNRGISGTETIELQGSETNTRVIVTQIPSQLQELTDAALPLSDSPTLRLNMEIDVAEDKYRRRVREARIRSKLAHYRAERLAHRFEERFGYYPEEDEEEAQTEAEQTDGE